MSCKEEITRLAIDARTVLLRLAQRRSMCVPMVDYQEVFRAVNIALWQIETRANECYGNTQAGNSQLDQKRRRFKGLLF